MPSGSACAGWAHYPWRVGSDGLSPNWRQAYFNSEESPSSLQIGLFGGGCKNATTGSCLCAERVERPGCTNVAAVAISPGDPAPCRSPDPLTRWRGCHDCRFGMPHRRVAVNAHPIGFREESLRGFVARSRTSRETSPCARREELRARLRLDSFREYTLYRCPYSA